MLKSNLIYLVDDDEMYLSVIEKYLKKINQKVIVFTGGEPFITQILNDLDTGELPDFIFLDLKMPNFNGWEVTNKLLELSDGNSIDFNIHIVTSSISKKDIELLETKYNDKVVYHIKPISKKKFINILNSNYDDEENKGFKNIS